MKKVAVVADSTCCLPKELIEKYDIHLVPLQIVYEGKTYRDRVDITPDEVFKIMRRRKNLPSTSNPLIADFADVCRTVGQKAESILCITVTGLQSSTHDIARMAKDAMAEIPIEVMDSRAVAGAFGFIVLEAARAAADGADLNNVMEVAQNIKGKVNAIFALDTLYYLARTGRIARAAAWAGSLLNMKPVVEHSPSIGETTPLARPRNKAKAVEYMLKTMAGRVKNASLHVMVHHADEPEEGKKLMDKIGSGFNCIELYLTDFTPGMGVHCGPGMLGISFYTD